MLAPLALAALPDRPYRPTQNTESWGISEDPYPALHVCENQEAMLSARVKIKTNDRNTTIFVVDGGYAG